MSGIQTYTPQDAVRELRETAAIANPSKWPVSMTADQALNSLRETLHELADRLEQSDRWAHRDDRLMNLKEAADYYGCSTDKLKQLAAAGWDKAVPLGEQWRFRKG